MGGLCSMESNAFPRSVSDAKGCVEIISISHPLINCWTTISCQVMFLT